MPFVLRKVEPRYLCRGHVPAGSAPQGWPVGAELEAVANGALTTTLKQLATLLTTAEDIFAELTAELTAVADRSSRLRQRIDKVEERLAAVDPKKVPVPESDICTFAARTEHFHIVNKPSTALFTSHTRPKALRELYEAAAIVAVRSLDSLRRDGSSMDMFLCTPVLGKKRRDQSLDIESRIPAAIEDLRRWTSTEALGDVTVPPDCMSRILGDTTGDDAVDHKLPSPEEQVQAVALKFPAEIVAVDVSGKGFERMSMRRRSLLSGPESQETAVKRRSRPRRPRGKRRNTIAGTDQKEIRQAAGGETTGEDAEETLSNIAARAHRSASTDILGSSKKESPTEKKSHFNTLKAWGMSRLKLISPKSNQQQELQEAAATSTERSGREQGQSRSPEETNIYETVTTRRRKDKSHERKPSSSSSSGKSTSSIPVSVPSTERQPSVKLRESAAQRRERRKGSSRDDPPHSSSGNWSASSESGRASIGSETTTTTHQPRSTTTASIGTSSTSLSHMRRFKGRDNSASSSVTSEGTLTPDIIQDIAVVPFSDDGETSSVYSCDTEGYYTSFHVDSGLKTLREEDPVPQSPLTRSNDVSSDPTSPVVENEYELFGRGSTSTTTSSAGTVCTALMAPPPPERKSSLTVVAMVHGQNQNGGESPDSGHNTSSSPVESASSPACTGRSCSEFEYSESSDLEGCERIERIRSKTAINTSRIPSMCVITPPGSDDEHARESDQIGKKSESRKPDLQTGGSVLMSATVGTSKMEVINGQDKNLYATVQVLPSSDKAAVGQTSAKISPLSGVLGKLRGVLPGRKHVSKNAVQDQPNTDSGDYVTIADVRNNNDKRQDTGSSSSTNAAKSPAAYANTDVFKKDAEYVSLSELPKKPDSSLERKRQGARVTLDSEGKVVYSSDSLKRRKGAHTTFNPGPFVREGTSPSPSPLLHRATPNIRAVTKTNDAVDGPTKSTPPTSPQLGKLIIRAARSPERAASPDYVRTPTTVVGPTSPTTPHRQVRGAYVNVQDDEDNTLLAIDSVPPHGIAQPPPYISPPKPEDCQKDRKIQEILKDSQATEKIKAQCENEQKYGPQGLHPQNICAHDPRQNLCNNNNRFIEQNKVPSYNECQRACDQRRIVHMHNARNQQYYGPGKDNSQQFYTLPSRRPQRDVEPPRSVTPDITRGLGRGSLSAMHMLARQGQRPITEQDCNRFGSQVDLNQRNSERFETENRLMKNHQQPPIVDVRNRFATPLGLTALGYRFFASSPVSDPVMKSPSADALKHNPISPIGHSYGNSFKPSTPAGRTMPTVAERLALTASNNCPSPMSNSGRSTPVQTSSGRSTPTNLILSPTKSTMSNEELFAAIHKSKKRLNIKDDSENLSPYGSTTSLAKMSPGSRHSWSSEQQKPPIVAPNVQSPSPATSRLDFKRLLLQQSVKTGPARLSAAEQLKLSRQQCQQQPASPTIQQTTPLAKVLSPRSVWRFQTPRTDVLSSTIIEDTAAEEKAMKPSPENTSPISRLNARRQLDLCSDLPNYSSVVDLGTRPSDACNDRLSGNVAAVDSRYAKEAEALIRNVHARELATRNSVATAGDNRLQTGSPQSTSVAQAVLDPYSQCNIGLPAMQYSSSCSQLTPTCQQAINAFESRRISNQLARAQFLASTPASTNQGHNTYVRQILRARSVSPQNPATQNVTRSPSAPTLETAL
ncbi:NHS actin remodeling regulator GUK-holder isoform X1 [Andrena cerasifolii]|uniref:NHS actin remodeling regulator GUK-holder isoform X1 n=1 Tax=Andrena cerasifolii TaxID=2819439 RepID=UPI004037644E